VEFSRRRFLQTAASAAASPAVSRSAIAQSYPTRPVRILVGFPPGGATDFHARLSGEWLSERLGQPFMVENRPGASGIVALDALVRAPADGYTLILSTSVDAINAALYDKLPFNFLRDTVPVSGIIRGQLVMVVEPQFPAKTVSEFVAYARANPGKINMASAGKGTPLYVAGELFKAMTGVNLLHVPYQGEGPALNSLLGGHVDVVFATMTATVEYIRAGRLRPLAVTAATRSHALPDTPTIDDSLPGYEVTTWTGIAAPKGTPHAVIETLNREVNAELASPSIKARYADLGATTFGGSPIEFGRFIVEDAKKWARMIKLADIKPE
jgi:tripartite-type tricarboxylate transporter receptor subunit TctC